MTQENILDQERDLVERFGKAFLNLINRPEMASLKATYPFLLDCSKLKTYKDYEAYNEGLCSILTFSDFHLLVNLMFQNKEFMDAKNDFQKFLYDNSS